MAREKGSSGQAAVLDAAQIKWLLKIAQTNHANSDQTVIVWSYWLGLRAKKLASLKIDDVYGDSSGIDEIAAIYSPSGFGLCGVSVVVLACGGGSGYSDGGAGWVVRR